MNTPKAIQGQNEPVLIRIAEEVQEHTRMFQNVDLRMNGMDERFEAIDQRFDAVDERFEAIDRRFDAVDKRFEAIDRRFEAVDVRFDGIDERLDTITVQMDAMTLKIVDNSDRLDRIEEKLTRVATKEDLSRVYSALDTIIGMFQKKDQEQTMLGHRVDRIEADVNTIKPLVGIV